MIRNVKRVVVGMSGGVDSSVTALLLKRKGFDVVGLFMKNWDATEEMGLSVCPGEKDAEDAHTVCRKLEIPFHQCHFVKEYWNDVFNTMLKDYLDGYTPNPDVLCNRHIKFDAFLKHAQNVFSADAIATGHYVRNSYGDFLENHSQKDEPHLLLPVDPSKDQTLALSSMPHSALKFSMFPLGNLRKSAVKDIARREGMLNIVARKESMGLCFIGKRDFKDFILQYTDSYAGRFVDLETGNVLGEHQGIHLYTLGQQARISGLKQKHYIAGKDKRTQTIFVAPGVNHPSLYCTSFYLSDFSWLGTPPEAFYEGQEVDCFYRNCHIYPLRHCTVSVTNGNELKINLPRAARAITPGQHTALYVGARCLGSGRVVNCGPSLYEMGRVPSQEELWEERKRTR